MPDLSENKAESCGGWRLEELSQRAGVPRRTIRYYIQLGLVPRPAGEKRGAVYGEAHLDRILEVRRLAQKGLSLLEIREALKRNAAGEALPERPLGSIEMRAHVYLGPGIELVIDRTRSSLTTEEIAGLAKTVLNAQAETANKSSAD